MVLKIVRALSQALDGIKVKGHVLSRDAKIRAKSLFAILFCSLLMVSFQNCSASKGFQSNQASSSAESTSASAGTGLTLGGVISLQVANSSIAGLPSGLELVNNKDKLSVASGSTSWVFPQPQVAGASYSIVVSSSPAGLTCSVSNGSGVFGFASVTNVVVSCTDGSGSGSSTASCHSSMSTWTPDPTQAFSVNKFGAKYAVQNNRWGTSSGQSIWAKDQNCWGVDTSWAMSPDTQVKSYPSVVRGWLHNGAMSAVGQLSIFSTPGTQDWTWNGSGMGIPLTALSQAKARWSFSPPTASGLRWGALMDVYFHRTREPDYNSGWQPAIDLMINQAVMDQAITSSDWRKTTFYAYVASGANPSVVTLGGNSYMIYIDEGGDIDFHKPEQNFVAGADYDRDGVSIQAINGGTDTDGNGKWNVTLAGITEAPGEFLNNNNGIPEEGEVVLGFGTGKAVVWRGNSDYVRTLYGITSSQMVLVDLQDDLNGDFHVTSVDAHLAYHRSNPNAATGHTIHMFLLPTQYTTNGTGIMWGSYNVKHDLKAIIDFLRGVDGRNWRADDGTTIKHSNGAAVSASLLSDDLYLTSVQAGLEANNGAFSYTNLGFCVSVQGETPCL